MNNNYFKAEFIAPDGEIPNSFTAIKSFGCTKKPVKAVLYITALGMYEAELNGKRVGESYFAPFWTSYNKMLQYQTYDVTDMLLKTTRFCSRWVRVGTAGLSDIRAITIGTASNLRLPASCL